MRRRNQPEPQAATPPPASGSGRRVTTAWQYAAYRDELIACGFTRQEAHHLVLTAARGRGFVTDLVFELKAMPKRPELTSVDAEGL